MNKKILTLVLAGIMALGGTAAVYAATNNKADTAPAVSSKTISENDSEENDDQGLTTENTKTAITEDQAKQTALASITGGVFTEIELEDEDGVIVYGIEIQAGNETYDVKVDANTGVIVKSEKDSGDDESKLENESNDNDNDSAEHETQNDEPDGAED